MTIESHRPSVSVVVPFCGSRDDACAMLAAFQRLRLADGDEMVIAENTDTETVPRDEGPRVVAARDEQSSYYARNVAAAVARNPWLAFIDADTLPDPDLLDAYFVRPIPDDVGAVIGEVAGREDQDALIARYSRTRGHISQEVHWRHPYRAYGVTANLLVRRAAWDSVGGFSEGVRSSGDVDFSWRLQEAGWRMEYRPGALVEHRHRDQLRALLRVGARYGAGRAWLHRRYPDGMGPPPVVRPIVRAVVGTLVWLATGRFERAAFKALDGVYVATQAAAGLLSNTPPGCRTGPTHASTAVVVSSFPALDDPLVSVLGAQGTPPAIEALHRPVRQDRAAARSLAVRYGDDDGTLRRLRALARLAGRAPVSVARVVRARGLGAALAAAASAERLTRAGVTEVRPAADVASHAAIVAKLAGADLGPPLSVAG